MDQICIEVNYLFKMKFEEFVYIINLFYIHIDLRDYMKLELIFQQDIKYKCFFYQGESVERKNMVIPKYAGYRPNIKGDSLL